MVAMGKSVNVSNTLKHRCSLPVLKGFRGVRTTGVAMAPCAQLTLTILNRQSERFSLRENAGAASPGVGASSLTF